MTTYKERLRTINTFIFDVDGVLTNGDVLLLNNEVLRSLNSRDAYALQHAARSGYSIFIITGGRSKDVEHRLLELGAKEVHLGASNKLTVYESIKERHGIRDEEVLYMGDDLPDYPVLSKVGVSTCPQDAAVEIKQLVHYQSPYNGGRHCVRDVIEQTMRLHGKWFVEEAFHW